MRKSFWFSQWRTRRRASALLRGGLALRANAVKFRAVFLQPVWNHLLHATVQKLLIGNAEVLERAALRATNMVVPMPVGFVARGSVVHLSLGYQALVHQ